VNRFQEPPVAAALQRSDHPRKRSRRSPSVPATASARVCYESPATNLVKNDLNKVSDVFVLDRCSCDMIALSRERRHAAHDGVGSCDLVGER
jgi:hypothetical protein